MSDDPVPEYDDGDVEAGWERLSRAIDEFERNKARLSRWVHWRLLVRVWRR